MITVQLLNNFKLKRINRYKDLEFTYKGAK